MTDPQPPWTTRDQVLAAPTAPASDSHRYGEAHPDQVVERFDPARPGEAGVLLLHGGCWRGSVDRAHISPLARALAGLGLTVWNVEYRRLDAGGGNPQTFDDVLAAAELVAGQAPALGVDPARVALVGHSAGGHLALWLAASLRRQGRTCGGVVALAAVCDLEASVDQAICRGDGARLLPAGTADAVTDVSPARMAPLGIDHHHVVGHDDQIVPAQHVRAFVDTARAAGDTATLTVVPGAHFEPIVPTGMAFEVLVELVAGLVGPFERG